MQWLPWFSRARSPQIHPTALGAYRLERAAYADTANRSLR
jgi:hypothetical protein